MRRIVMWALSTITALVLLFGYDTSTSSSLPLGSEIVAPAAAVPGTSDTSAGTSASTTVTGPSVDTRWGPVQVQVSVQDGKVTGITVVDYPDNNPKDQQINARALPILTREALAAQSADIDMVSGATVTSEGYLQSLQGALDQAGL